METRLTKQVVEQTVFKKIKTKDLKPVKLNEDRDHIREHAMLEAAYEQDGDKKLQEKEDEDERASGKEQIRIFGYKHPKAVKFYA